MCRIQLLWYFTRWSLLYVFNRSHGLSSTLLFFRLSNPPPLHALLLSAVICCLSLSVPSRTATTDEWYSWCQCYQCEAWMTPDHSVLLWDCMCVQRTHQLKTGADLSVFICVLCSTLKLPFCYQSQPPRTPFLSLQNYNNIIGTKVSTQKQEIRNEISMMQQECGQGRAWNIALTCHAIVALTISSAVIWLIGKYKLSVDLQFTLQQWVDLSLQLLYTTAILKVYFHVQYNNYNSIWQIPSSSRRARNTMSSSAAYIVIVCSFLIRVSIIWIRFLPLPYNLIWVCDTLTVIIFIGVCRYSWHQIPKGSSSIRPSHPQSLTLVACEDQGGLPIIIIF